MFIATVYIRFFRSFNFDYLRKAHDRFVVDPWDELESDGLQYPFVKVPLEDGITTVVGANESGKSQLLWAMKHALTGQGIERGDFCRYSQFFAVNKAMAFPDFGLEFKNRSVCVLGRDQCGMLTELARADQAVYSTGMYGGPAARRPRRPRPLGWPFCWP
jgi:hypothetical protein